MHNTFSATLIFLKDGDGRICLAPKKENIHKDGQELANSRLKWNGYGGKQEAGETIQETAVRELQQESGVICSEDDLDLVARINFFWPRNETPIPDMEVFVFFCVKFDGVPQEGEREMGAPYFFTPNEIPYDQMMPADKLFLPRLLAGEKLTWDVYLGKTSNNGNIYFEDKQTLPTL